MRNFKKAMALGLAAVLTLTGVACSSGKDSASGDKSSDKSVEVSGDKADYEECELTISWWGGDSRHNATKEALAAFMKKYPKITVKETYNAWDGWEETMSTQFSSNTAPDINQINWNWITSFSKDGSKFIDINDVSNVIDLTQFGQEYLDMCTVADKLQAVPVSMTGRIFYWNKTTFDKVGISVPTSYAELLEAGKKFKEYDESYYPLCLGEFDRMILMVYYLESVYNKEWVSDGKLNYSEEEVKKGLEFIQGLEDNHVTPSIKTITGDGAESLDKNQKWMDGHYAGIWEWDSSASKFGDALEKGQEFVVGSYFNDYGGENAQGGYSKVSLAWAISQTCKHPKEAAMLVDYLLNDTDAAVILGSERGIPLSTAAKEAANTAGKLNATVLEANEKVLSWVKFSLDPYFEDASLKSDDGVYIDVMEGFSYGDYDIDEATTTLMDGITELLDSKN